MTDPLEKKIKLTSESQPKSQRSLGERLKLSRLWKGSALAAEGQNQPTAERPRRRLRLNWKMLFFPLIIFILLVVFALVFGLLPLLALEKDARQLNQELKGVTEGIQTQNLNQSVEKLEKTKVTLGKLKSDYRKLMWVRMIPFIGGYYQDGQRLINGGNYLLEGGDIALEALQPYADILGLEGKDESKKPEEMTTEERLMLALDTLDKLQPSLDEIGGKLDLARGEIDQIKPNRYPETLFGKKIRENVVLVINMIDNTAELASEIQPIVSYLKPLLGIPEEKKYLLIFQNDAELRPTGGFLTAYAILSVKNGRFTPLASHDIYTLDALFGNRLKAPEPILNYHKNVFYWHLRDMNLSPDFKVSMETFLENYEKVAGKGTVDAVVAVDTEVLVDLLRVLGPIGVSGWGNFSAENDERCDCPQVFYELERFADKPVQEIKEERKAIIGPLMHSIILNAMGSPRKKWPEFFNVAFANLQEKHILLYFFDEEIQKAIEALNAGGRIRDYDGDYLHINDCNFAGAKSNMYIEQQVSQVIEIASDGTVTKTLTIDYKNPAPPSNCNLEAGELCLNGLYRDWLRVYVPKGSELIEASGSEIEVKTYEDLGKTVFEAFYGDQSPLRPEGKAQLQFKYKLPFKMKEAADYRLLIQKQPGTDNHEYLIKLGKKEEAFELNTDREIKL